MSIADHIRTILLQNPGVVNTSGDWIAYVSRFNPATTAVGRQVAIFDTGGAPPEPSLLLDYPTVMVQVRGNKDDYTAAFNKVKEVKDRLLGSTPQVMGNGDRISGILGLGDINSLGYDESDRPLFSVNFRLFVEPVTNSLTHRVSL